MTAPQRLVPLPTCDLGRSPAFPRFLASKAPCNGRYGMGKGSDWRFFNQLKRELKALASLAGARAGNGGLTA